MPAFWHQPPWCCHPPPPGARCAAFAGSSAAGEWREAGRHRQIAVRTDIHQSQKPRQTCVVGTPACEGLCRGLRRHAVAATEHRPRNRKRAIGGPPAQPQPATAGPPCLRGRLPARHGVRWHWRPAAAERQSPPLRAPALPPPSLALSPPPRPSRSPLSHSVQKDAVGWNAGPPGSATRVAWESAAGASRAISRLWRMWVEHTLEWPFQAGYLINIIVRGMCHVPRMRRPEGGTETLVRPAVAPHVLPLAPCPPHLKALQACRLAYPRV